MRFALRQALQLHAGRSWDGRVPTPGFVLPLNDAGAGVASTTPERGIGAASFTRATTGTTILPTGLLGSVASGSLRSRYNSGGSYLGASLEIAATNLCLQSQDIAATWTPSGTTIGTAVASPDGTNTAKKLQEDNTNAQHGVLQVIAKAASAIAYSVSVYVKPGERSWFLLQVDNNGANGMRKWFNVTAGTLGTGAGFGASPFTISSTSIEAAANGFYRCTVNIVSDASASIRILACTATADNTVTFVGVTGSGLYPWGFQLETGTFPSSYIPTTAGSGSRNLDQLTFPSSGNTSATRSTIRAEFSSAKASTQVLLGTGAGVSGTPLYTTVATDINTADGANITTKAGVGSLLTSVRKWGAFWYDSKNGVIADGTIQASGIFDGDMNQGNTISIGSQFDGSSPMSGTIKNIRSWVGWTPNANQATII